MTSCLHLSSSPFLALSLSPSGSRSARHHPRNKSPHPPISAQPPPRPTRKPPSPHPLSKLPLPTRLRIRTPQRDLNPRRRRRPRPRAIRHGPAHLRQLAPPAQRRRVRRIPREPVRPEDVDLPGERRHDADGGGQGAIGRECTATATSLIFAGGGVGSVGGEEVRSGDEGGAEVVGFLVVDGAGGAGDDEFVDGGLGAEGGVVVEVGGAVLGHGGEVGVVAVEEVGEAGACRGEEWPRLVSVGQGEL